MSQAPLVEAKLVIPSSKQHLKNVRELIENSAEHLGFSTEDIQRIVTAAFEAVVNAITHGSPLGEANTVEISIRGYDDRITIEVKDQGEGLTDTGSYLMPDTSSRRGRGIPLMHVLMDNVRILKDNTGSRVVLTKYLNGNSPD